MASLATKTAAALADLTSGAYLYVMNAAASAEYKVTLAIMLQATLPSQTGNANKALVTNGSGTLSWALVDSLPTQTGNSGKYLTTDGSTASWAAVFSNPMTTSGDIIYGGASGAATRLAKGTDGQVLTLASGIPSWATASGGSGGISKLAETTLGANASTFTISGLDLNTDKRLRIIFRHRATSGANFWGMYYNSDNTAANYETQYDSVAGASYAGSRATNYTNLAIVEDTFPNVTTIDMFKPESGYGTVAYGFTGRAGAASNSRADGFTHIYRTTTNVTSLTFTFGATFVAAGTSVAIYKYT